MFNIPVQKEIGEMKCQMLNIDQHQAFAMIMKAVQDKNHLQTMFFVSASGGYGKTFLIEALLSTVRGMGKIALAVASSGMCS